MSAELIPMPHIQDNSIGKRCWDALINRFQVLQGVNAHDAAFIINGIIQAEKKVTRTPFVKPSLAEIDAYLKEIGYEIDPGSFRDCYEANGWTVGKNKPMRSWEAACRMWQREGWGKKKEQPRDQGYASLGALQLQLKSVQDEMRDILHPGGTAYQVKPTDEKLARFNELSTQRERLRAKLARFI